MGTFALEKKTFAKTVKESLIVMSTNVINNFAPKHFPAKKCLVQMKKDVLEKSLLVMGSYVDVIVSADVIVRTVMMDLKTPKNFAKISAKVKSQKATNLPVLIKIKKQEKFMLNVLSIVIFLTKY